MTSSEFGYTSASTYDLKGACLDADEIVVDNELITTRAVEDYFSSVALSEPEPGVTEASADSSDKSADELARLVVTQMAPGEPASDVKDTAVAGKEQVASLPDRPTSFPVPLPKQDDNVSPVKTQSESKRMCSLNCMRQYF